MNDTHVAPKLSALRAFIEAGYTLIPVCSPTKPHEHWSNGAMKPCKTPGKIPTRAHWQSTGFGAHSEKELTGYENYGVALGAGDLIVDVDPRNFPAGDKVLGRLVALLGGLPDTFTVRTGGGGLHIYFRKPADFPISQALRDFPGIEFKTSGRQVVGPGSLHSGTGKLYEVIKGSPLEIADAPPKLLELLKKSVTPFSDTGTGAYIDDTATQDRFASYLKDAEVSVEGKSGDLNAFRVACHGRDLGLSPATTLGLMLSLWNDRCLPPWTEEELKTKVINAYKFAKAAVGNAHPAAAFEAVAPAPPKKDPDPVIAWVTTGPNKTIVKCFQNLLNYMRLPAGGLHKIFAFNELAGRVEFVRPAPWHSEKMPAFAGVSDNDLKLCKGYLATRHGFEASLLDIEAAIANVAHHDRFHPVREFLYGLKWDGVKRLDTWMADYLGAIDGGYPEYLAAVSRKVICAAVMRALRPGIKFDHVVVLEGAQDIGKSSTVSILGGEHASDSPVDPHSRDTVDAMQGRWFIEMAEMEQLRKVDEDALKAFITRKTDRVRLAYGRATGEYPRQSIFIATKNPGPDGTYLKDATGNRRWWPVRCEPKMNDLGQIDFRGLQAVRNQLFAEAMEMCKKIRRPEELSMDTPLLKEQAKAVVEQRHASHAWTEGIASWIERCDSKVETRRDFLTSRDVYIEAIGGSEVRMTHRDMTAIAGVLRKLGWTQKSKRIGRDVFWGWTRETPAEKQLDDLLAGL